MTQQVQTEGCSVKTCDKAIGLIHHQIHGLWLLLCREHMNGLSHYLNQTQDHEDYLVNHAQYRRIMSGYPTSSGMSNDREIVSEQIRLENKVRGIIEAWLRDPEKAERFIDDR